MPSNTPNRGSRSTPSRTISRERIKSACHELEQALADFENDSEAEQRAKAEAEKLRALKRQLADIRRQLDALD